MIQANAAAPAPAPAAAPAPSSTDTWQLRQTRLDARHRRRDQTLFALANGSLGVRADFEEGDDSSGTYLAALYESHPIHYHERFPGFARSTDTRVPVADGQRIAVWLGTERVDIEQAQWLEFERTLHFREGRLQRRLRLLTMRGHTIEIQAERVVPFRTSPTSADVLAIRYSVRSIDYQGSLALASAIEFGHGAVRQGDDPRIGVTASDRLQLLSNQADRDGASVLQATQRSGLRVRCAQSHRLGDKLAFDCAGFNDGTVEQRFRADVQPGDVVEIEKFVAYATSDGTCNPAASTTAALAEATAAGFDAVARRHADALAAFWDDTTVTVEGSPDDEQALRFNLFHLFQSAGRDGSHGTAAKGLTGEGYEGHCFWDTEAFMLPVMAFTAPDVARTMLQARYGALDAARQHARGMSHPRGALYPWRTIAGLECSAHYPSGSAAYHINAAIAHAIGLYVDATDDIAFLLEGGAEMLFETARIWPQAGHFDARRGGAFCIHAVTGPDEYTALVDNNFHTNRMAQRHLRLAASTWDHLHAHHPLQTLELAARLGLDAAEVDVWRRAAAAMYLNYDESLGIHAQDDTFLGKPTWPGGVVKQQGQRPLLLDHHPIALYRHQVCKQADVVMALVLAGDGIAPEVKRRNFDYYEAVTTHDSTLSASVFGILASEVGHHDKAAQYFRDNLFVDLDNLHGNTDHGMHMAALAGSWLGLVQGFAGMRVIDGVLCFSPTLPDGWSGYGFGLRWKGRLLHVLVRPTGVEYTLRQGDALPIEHRARTLELARARPARMPLVTAAGAAAVTRQPVLALIFDLDGVLTDTARTHYLAWKRIADEERLPFDERVNERLKGIDRMGSLEIILQHAGRVLDDGAKVALAERKNRYYVEAIEEFTPDDLFPGVASLLQQARKQGLRIGLASASRNASRLLERLGITDCFDHVADASRVARPKPDPEIFLGVAAALGVSPSQCIGLEDSAAGIAAIRSAGMTAVGIGQPDDLVEADICLPAIAAFDLDALAS
ncbi:MAG TPA: beta-phosphoglucomutase [Lysobacter sp.]